MPAPTIGEIVVVTALNSIPRLLVSDVDDTVETITDILLANCANEMLWDSRGGFRDQI
ncbi:hypothetical protein [Haloarcula amylovorans]|uniref:hypothetical protein n=1 Tax=Haloarcula amylovorans TaxID=2562280 RepID=UPI0014306D5D|nr:hypothetical protein [Halomicroarcula amylolytica]